MESKDLTKKKVGRPTWKNPEENYARIFVDIPKDYKNKIKLLLCTDFKDQYQTQNEVIYKAIQDFLKKHNQL